MIVADKKPIEEIIEEIKDRQRILILGCNECVTVCEAGGKKEVGVLASALRMYFLNQGSQVKIDEITLERQCDHEYLEELRGPVKIEYAKSDTKCVVRSLPMRLILKRTIY